MYVKKLNQDTEVIRKRPARIIKKRPACSTVKKRPARSMIKRWASGTIKRPPGQAAGWVRLPTTLRSQLRAPAARIRIGTDCAGLEVMMSVLADMNVDATHVFSCERVQVLQAFAAQAFQPLKLYTDMTTRDNTDPYHADDNDLTIYGAGIACQPFSIAGNNMGEADMADGGRGSLFDYALDFINHRKPQTFLIENVENLTRMHRATFDSWLAQLHGINDGMYNIHWDILQTSHHGLPQHRRRVYIIGIRRDVQRHPFSFPARVDPVSLTTLLDNDDVPPSGLLSLPTSKTGINNVTRGLKTIIARGLDPSHVPAVIDAGASHGTVTFGAAPTLTASRCAQRGFWLLHMGRPLNLLEMMRLQGMRPARFQVPSFMRPSQMSAAVGNAMSGNVLHRVVARMLWSLGMDMVQDQWQVPELAAQKLLL